LVDEPNAARWLTTVAFALGFTAFAVLSMLSGDIEPEG
jgi:hypothetical protein